MTQDQTTGPDAEAETPTPWRPSRTVAVVLAGGTGTRLGLGIPKQLLKIAGKPIIEHTLAVFEAAPEIDEIIVLMATGHVDDAQQIVDKAGLRKVTKVIEGGDTRNATTRIALDAVGAEDCNILFHDAVRPLLSGRIVRECVNALWSYDAVDVAIPSADTIIQVDENDCITDIPVRSRLRRGQTPQAFRSATIREAYQLAEGDPDFAATDDCGVVLRYLPGTPIKVIDGSDENIKVTHPVDVHLADKLFQLAAAQAPRLTDHRSYTRGADRPDHRRVRRQLRHRPRADRAGPALRRPGLPVQPLQHRHPRGAGRGRRGRADDRLRGHRPDRPRGGHRRHPGEGRPRRDGRGDHGPAAPGQLRRPGDHRPPGPARTSSRPRASCCSTPPAPTPGAGPATRSTRPPRPPWSTSPRRCRRVGRRRRPRQLHQPGAHRHPDADARRSARSRSTPCSPRRPSPSRRWTC